MNKYHYPSIYSDHNQDILIVSELPENQGASVTNRAEWLHRQLCRNYDLDPEETIFIEHYGPGSLQDENTYDQVFFTISPTGDFSRLEWTPLDPGEVRQLIDAEPPQLEARDWTNEI